MPPELLEEERISMVSGPQFAANRGRKRDRERLRESLEGGDGL